MNKDYLYHLKINLKYSSIIRRKVYLKILKNRESINKCNAQSIQKNPTFNFQKSYKLVKLNLKKI